MGPEPTDGNPAGWRFLSNHAHVLICVAREPGIRLRDIALQVGLTERAAHRLLSQLVDESYVVREKEGRRNRYAIGPATSLRHPLIQDRDVRDLLKALIG